MEITIIIQLQFNAVLIDHLFYLILGFTFHVYAGFPEGFTELFTGGLLNNGSSMKG